MMNAKEMMQVYKLAERRDGEMSLARRYATAKASHYASDKQNAKTARKYVKSARKINAKLVAIKATGSARPMSLVFRTVIGLISEAREDARQYAVDALANIAAQIAAAGSIEAATPIDELPRGIYSDWSDAAKKLRAKHDRQQARRSFFHMVSTPEGAAKFILDEVQSAEAQYVEFACKLERKVGEVTEATLDGSHVWGLSVLTVKTVGGETVKWQTRQITNTSVLGKRFPQWPSRVIK